MNHFIKYFTFHPVISMNLAPRLLRWCGVKVGKHVFIAQGVFFDAHPDAIEIGDDVLFAPNVQVLTHQRDLSYFQYGTKFHDIPHITRPVKFCNNCLIGIGATIMPGVTIGEGAMVAAGSVVTRDVPPYTIVAGSPAKPIREYLPDGTTRKPEKK